MTIADRNPLNWWLTAPEDEIFEKYHDQVWDLGADNKPDERYIYLDNGADVLLVAHLDTVQKPVINFVCEEFIEATGLDDRLGAYIINEILVKQQGLKVDVLLTTNEEKGRSTAGIFRPSHQYKWTTSFDRRGNDVVLYKYLNSATWRTAIETIVPKRATSWGMYSCIQSLKVGACGMNIGCGYYDNHSLKAYALVDEINLAVDFFLKFYEKYKSTEFAYDDTQSSHRTITYSGAGYKSYGASGGYGNGSSVGLTDKSNTPVDVTTLKGTHSLEGLSKRAQKRCKKWRQKHNLCVNCGYPEINTAIKIDPVSLICNICQYHLNNATGKLKCDVCQKPVAGVVIWVGASRYCSGCYRAKTDAAVAKLEADKTAKEATAPTYATSWNKSEPQGQALLPINGNGSGRVKPKGPSHRTMVAWYCDCGHENKSPKAALRWLCAECGGNFANMQN